jgi:ABC-type sugar transport system ATPase subunit
MTEPEAAPLSPSLVPVLEVRGLAKEFPGTRALDNVSLEVRPSEIHALLGENGAGKSTLIKCVAGAQPPTEGQILVDGKPVSFAAPHDATAAGIAVVHQHSNLIPSLSVEENLWLGELLPRRLGVLVDWRAVRERAREIMNYVHADIPPDAIVGELRPDQRAMISIAKAVASNARLIVLDEPTTALLPHEVETLFAEMRRLSREGHAFLYVSHRLAEVFDIADRATVLRDGRNAGTFERGAMDRHAIIAAIVGSQKALREGRPPATTTERGVLTVEGLSGRRVEDVSFSLRAGEILGIAGLPGSGADETINLLFGRNQADAGRVSVDDRPIRLRDPSDAIAAGIALVPKDRLAEAVFHSYSVRENISLPSLARYIREPIVRFINRAAEDRAAREVVERLRVRTPGIETAIDALSGGNQQKTVLGRWLTTGAKVFLLNSPTAAVDVGAKAEIYDHIRALAAGGAAIVFSSTEVEEFPSLCERVLVFSKGKIAGELSGDDVTEANIMTIASGGSLVGGSIEGGPLGGHRN